MSKNIIKILNNIANDLQKSDQAWASDYAEEIRAFAKYNENKKLKKYPDYAGWKTDGDPEDLEVLWIQDEDGDRIGFNLVYGYIEDHTTTKTYIDHRSIGELTKIFHECISITH